VHEKEKGRETTASGAWRNNAAAATKQKRKFTEMESVGQQWLVTIFTSSLALTKNSEVNIS
jgi:hypothetical protein